jgi:7-keto-8-aminopelargonate synthetase-like enzyme
MDYEGFFKELLDALRSNGASAAFRAPLITASAPRSPSGVPNDYLGMGQRPAVLAAMQEALRRWVRVRALWPMAEQGSRPPMI